MVADYELLNTRVTDRLCIDWSSDKWNNCLIIVCNNAAKDHLNVKAAEVYAQRTGHALHWYYSTDTHSRHEVKEPELKDHLRALHSNLTSQRLGMIPLVIGMPVMLNTNYDVEGGIMNGCMSILKKICYTSSKDSERHTTSCVIESPTLSGCGLPCLSGNQCVAITDTVDISFTHLYSKKRLKLKWMQVPLMPAFTMTAYKSQGQMLDTAVVDLQSCRGSEASYVMLSRVWCLVILHPFLYKKICCRHSEDLREEITHQKFLELLTLSQHGSAQLKVDTIAVLQEY